MTLPASEQATVPPDKLLNYLLSIHPPVGFSKVRRLRALGFNEATANLLEQELLAVARVGHVVRTQTTRYGVKYVVDGEISTPVGIRLPMRTVWIVEPNMTGPRLVTAYPVAQQRG